MTLKEEYHRILDKLAKKFGGIMDKRGEWSKDYELWFTEYEAWSVSDMLYIVSEYDTILKRYEGDNKEEFRADIERWIDYNVAVAEFGIQYINLKSWLMGAPRMSDKEIEKLRSLKMDLHHEIEAQIEKHGAQKTSSQPQHLADIYKPY